MKLGRQRTLEREMLGDALRTSPGELVAKSSRCDGIRGCAVIQLAVAASMRNGFSKATGRVGNSMTLPPIASRKTCEYEAATFDHRIS